MHLHARGMKRLQTRRASEIRAEYQNLRRAEGKYEGVTHILGWISNNTHNPLLKTWRTLRIDHTPWAARPKPGEWPHRDRAGQLSSKFDQLLKQRGEACGSSHTTSSSSSWLKHSCHISEELRADVVVLFKQAGRGRACPLFCSTVVAHLRPHVSR